jgi:hypothetical protein
MAASPSGISVAWYIVGITYVDVNHLCMPLMHHCPQAAMVSWLFFHPFLRLFWAGE